MSGGGRLARGGYFDAYGIIRDVMQNHLAQLLALARWSSLGLEANDVPQEKVRAYALVRCLIVEM